MFRNLSFFCLFICAVVSVHASEQKSDRDQLISLLSKDVEYSKCNEHEILAYNTLVREMVNDAKNGKVWLSEEKILEINRRLCLHTSARFDDSESDSLYGFRNTGSVVMSNYMDMVSCPMFLLDLYRVILNDKNKKGVKRPLWNMIWDGLFRPEQWIQFQHSSWIGTHFKYVESEIEDFLSEVNFLACLDLSENEYYQIAAYIYRGFVAIHPFRIGNGRVAKLITNSFLISKGCKPLIIPSSRKFPVDRVDFNRALRASMIRERLFAPYPMPGSKEERYLFRSIKLKEVKLDENKCEDPVEQEKRNKLLNKHAKEIQKLIAVGLVKPMEELKYRTLRNLTEEEIEEHASGRAYFNEFLKCSRDRK